VKNGCRIQADLIDISLLAKKNNNYKWILSVIDVQSRYAWAFPCKKKDPAEILRWLKKVNKELNISTITVDDGSEFKSVVKKWANQNGFEIWIANPKQNTKGRTALVENFNRIILRILFKYMRSNNIFNWSNVLQEVVNNYNSDKKLNKKFKNDRVLIDHLKIGDYVRIINPRNIFSKPTREPDWSDDVYRIMTRDHARYVLVDKYFKIVDLHYLPRQLLKVEYSKSVEPSDFIEQEKDLQRKISKQAKSGIDYDKESGDPTVHRSMKVKDLKRKVNKPLKYND
jgi:hypothetical protein